MDNLRLIKSYEADERLVRNFYNSWVDSNEKIVPACCTIAADILFSDWVQNKKNCEHRDTTPEHLVPSSTFFLTDGCVLLGAIDIRHYLNDRLFNVGGHIGYGIIKSARGNGYAVRMLELAVPILKSLQLDKVLITCDKTNIASAKTILNFGGALENEIFDGEKIMQRYWVEIK